MQLAEGKVELDAIPMAGAAKPEKRAVGKKADAAD